MNSAVGVGGDYVGWVWVIIGWGWSPNQAVQVVRLYNLPSQTLYRQRQPPINQPTQWLYGSG
ncbi:hypothetical protein COX08_01620 [Candidatus Beckwithbacteria bacterium CG23_combo_of_CG06-09_8_20_14_all_34_8]|uniref:Uncharacterized protein n=1 Tax=Candidatus Beckwithbacteria bacterium CG23_combo_of_CG06-09_8_20_14_all_34_8 TaxID=1974497 RepID=A0A2H0B6N1_9BACT|nr:MAG: hypothetical protein COX08_01620 [Candidatus Beckwithbacteria bacterium CG23_combo_of_CG06-09_8_20_14_all_34_8]